MMTTGKPIEKVSCRSGTTPNTVVAAASAEGAPRDAIGVMRSPLGLLAAVLLLAVALPAGGETVAVDVVNASRPTRCAEERSEERV